MYPPEYKRVESALDLPALDEQGEPIPEKRGGFFQPLRDVKEYGGGFLEGAPDLAKGLAKFGADMFTKGPIQTANEAALEIGSRIGQSESPAQEAGWQALEQNPLIPIPRGLFSGNPETFARDLGRATPGIMLAMLPFAKGKLGARTLPTVEDLGNVRNVTPKGRLGEGQRRLPEGDFAGTADITPSPRGDIDLSIQEPTVPSVRPKPPLQIQDLEVPITREKPPVPVVTNGDGTFTNTETGEVLDVNLNPVQQDIAPSNVSERGGVVEPELFYEPETNLRISQPTGADTLDTNTQGVNVPKPYEPPKVGPEYERQFRDKVPAVLERIDQEINPDMLRERIRNLKQELDWALVTKDQDYIQATGEMLDFAKSKLATMRTPQVREAQGQIPQGPRQFGQADVTDISVRPQRPSEETPYGPSSTSEGANLEALDYNRTQAALPNEKIVDYMKRVMDQQDFAFVKEVFDKDPQGWIARFEDAKLKRDRSQAEVVPFSQAEEVPPIRPKPSVEPSGPVVIPRFGGTRRNKQLGFKESDPAFDEAVRRLSEKDDDWGVSSARVPSGPPSLKGGILDAAIASMNEETNPAILQEYLDMTTKAIQFHRGSGGDPQELKLHHKLREAVASRLNSLGSEGGVSHARVPKEPNYKELKKAQDEAYRRGDTNEAVRLGQIMQRMDEMKGQYSVADRELMKSRTGTPGPAFGSRGNYEPSFAKVDEEHAKMDIGDPREMIEIFRNTYQGNTPHVATKELLQNAIDAANERTDGMGQVDIEIDGLNNLVKVQDNGPGITRAMIDKEYTNLSASGKRGKGKTIGEMGVGKTTYLITGADVQVETVVREDDGSLWLHSFGGDPETMLTGFKIRSRKLPETGPHAIATGTTVTYTAEPGAKFDTLQTYVNHFDKYSETKVPVNINGKIRHHYTNWQGNPAHYDDDIDISKQPSVSIGGRVLLEKEIDGTKYKLTIPDNAQWSFDQNSIALILNGRGMFQGVDSVWFNPGELPDRIIVDLEPTVKATDTRYPLTAPTRERLKDTTSADIKAEIQKILVTDAEAARKARFLQLFDAIQPEGNAAFPIYDSGKRMTPAEKDYFNNSVVMKGLHDIYGEVVQELIALFPEAIQSGSGIYGVTNVIKHLGFIFDEKLLGVNIKRPDSNDHIMALNIFNSITTSKTVQQAAQSIIHVIAHEFNHMMERSEGKGFTSSLARLYEKWDLEAQINARNKIGQIISERQFPGGRGYNRETQKLLQLYTDSRGRPESETDILLREAGSGVTEGGREEYVSPIYSDVGSGVIGESGAGGGGNKPPTNRPVAAAGAELPPGRGPRESNVKFAPKKTPRTKREFVGFGGGGGGGGKYKPPPKGFAGQPAGPNANVPLQNGKGSIPLELWNLSRGIKTIWDFSAPLRQGVGLITHKAFWTSLDDMFKAFGSEQSYQAIMDEIKSRPNFSPKGKGGKSFAELSGLDMSDLLSKREENLVSKWADKIPGGRRSNRAYTAFLNKLRADVFDSMVKHNPEMTTNPALAEAMADMINMSSGRGSLGRFEHAGRIANQLLFSPKLIASRLQMLNPHYYITAHPAVRMQALRNLAGVTATGLTFAGLGKLMGADVSLDPENSDFGKIRFGKVRLDPWGGHQQYVVAFTRFAKAYRRQMPEMMGGRDKRAEFGKSMGDVSLRFGRSKLHPTAGFAVDMAFGRDFKGDRVKMPQAVMDLYTPMIAEDLQKLYKEDPSLLPLAIPEAFGMGLEVRGR